jgi:hypothetical protein
MSKPDILDWLFALMDATKTVAAVESTTPQRFIEEAVLSAVKRVQQKHERARKPRAIRVFVKKGDGFVLNPIIARERELDRLMGKSEEEDDSQFVTAQPNTTQSTD